MEGAASSPFSRHRSRGSEFVYGTAMVPATPSEARSASQSGGSRPLRFHWLFATWKRRGDPQLQKRVALATIFAVTLGAFLHVVEDFLDNDPIVRWDVEFSRWLHLHSEGALVSFFKVATLAGSVAFLALLAVGVAYYFFRRRMANEAALILVSALGIEILNGGLKLLFHRPRPELAYVHLDTYSFPSGHSAGATAIYAVVFYLLAARRGVSIGWRTGAALGLVALVVLIAFSRLYLEVHYLSDVLAGCSLGAAWASGCLFVYESRRDFDIRRHLPARVSSAVERLAARSTG